MAPSGVASLHQAPSAALRSARARHTSRRFPQVTAWRSGPGHASAGGGGAVTGTAIAALLSRRFYRRSAALGRLGSLMAAAAGPGGPQLTPEAVLQNLPGTSTLRPEALQRSAQWAGPAATARATSSRAGSSFSRASSSSSPSVPEWEPPPAAGVPEPDAVDLANLRCAPRGLVEALAEALGLPANATPRAVALAIPEIQERAVHVARTLLAGNLTEVIGPGRLMASEWILAPREELAEQLARCLGGYMEEILSIIRVSTAFNDLSQPVAHWRSPWADAAISAMHVRALWGTPAVRASLPTPWAHLGVGFSMLDGAISPSLGLRARAELDALAGAGRLTGFSNSTCNPGARHLWLYFDSEEGRRDMPPALREIAEKMIGLPGALEAAAKVLAAGASGELDVPRLRVHPAVMAATYGPGSYYIPHLDMYSSGSHGFMNSRMLTMICYLNADWQHGDGGEFRLYASQEGGSPHDERSAEAKGARLPKLLGIGSDHSEGTTKTAADSERYMDIEPLLGRIVMFNSREVWHGIQELTYQRWAVTLWVLADTT